MNITVGAAPLRISNYVPGAPRATYASNHQGKVSRIAHPAGNIDAAGGNSGGNTSPNPYSPNPFTLGVAPLSDGGTLGCGGGALKPSNEGEPEAASSLISPYPTPSAGTFNVYRNKGGDVPGSANAPWQAAGGGGAGAVGGNAGPESSDGQSQSAGDGGAGYNAASNISWMTTSYGASGVFGGGGGAGGTDGAPKDQEGRVDLVVAVMVVLVLLLVMMEPQIPVVGVVVLTPDPTIPVRVDQEQSLLHIRYNCTYK